MFASQMSDIFWEIIHILVYSGRYVLDILGNLLTQKSAKYAAAIGELVDHYRVVLES